MRQMFSKKQIEEMIKANAPSPVDRYYLYGNFSTSDKSFVIIPSLIPDVDGAPVIVITSDSDSIIEEVYINFEDECIQQEGLDLTLDASSVYLVDIMTNQTIKVIEA